MNTNKTRIAYYDNIASQPHQVVILNEFIIYQDAIDYIETYAKALVSFAGDSAWFLYVYSYDFPSYQYNEAGGELQKSVITFPSNID